jgi:hypothetical protein
MAKTVTVRRVATSAVLALSLAGCANEGASKTDQQDRAQVSQHLDELNQGLQAGSWSKVEHFFSPAYQEGYGELRDRLEERFRNERIVDLQFTVNRVLETDGLVNAQVRWHKAWIDKTGKTSQSTGLSEFILKPQSRGYRILQIRGDPLF